MPQNKDKRLWYKDNIQLRDAKSRTLGPCDALHYTNWGPLGYTCSVYCVYTISVIASLRKYGGNVQIVIVAKRTNETDCLIRSWIIAKWLVGYVSNFEMNAQYIIPVIFVVKTQMSSTYPNI